MGDYCNGTEYSFVELSHKIQNSSTGIEQLFQYWRHTTKVTVLARFFFFLTHANDTSAYANSFWTELFSTFI